MESPAARRPALGRRGFIATTSALSAGALLSGACAPASADPASDAAPQEPTVRELPDLGPNVRIFDPSTPAAEIQAHLDAVFTRQETAQFGPDRDALLFLPGTYQVDANIGYYTQIAGLGLLPGDVVINGQVHVEADWFDGNATHNFWRAAENLAVEPSAGFDRWAVSQASPYRRMHLRGDLVLDDGGWSSGGFMADCRIDGRVESGSQQQWLTRDSHLAGGWNGANYNMVFVGTEGAPGNTFPDPPHVAVDESPVVREKPFLYVDGDGAFHVFAPALRTDTRGTTWESGAPEGTSVPLEEFTVIRPGDGAAEMNAALAAGRHLLITPGVYRLDATLEVTAPGTIVLGLGLATLVPDGGIIAVEVADVDGVRIAGLLIDAGETDTFALMRVGPDGSSADHSADPTSLHDVFFRIGGAHVGRAQRSLVINSHHVIGDHLWLWRGDHGDGIGWDLNTAAEGLVVGGDHVTVYGLFVEHYQWHQTVWNGNHGRTYFFQSEMPYDPPDQAAWMDGDRRGFASYMVTAGVTAHEAWGVGSYCFFSADPSVVSDRAFLVPETGGVRFHCLTTVSLGGTGTIAHIINGTGDTAGPGNDIARLTAFP
ncbi:adenylyl cyclase [Nocardiopsis protaetiae]|uniref:adenylyl cyclase n=1 Tax=Nocardiopsis protaetiae TaxID=3382270 RepID=UPI00387B3325